MTQCCFPQSNRAVSIWHRAAAAKGLVANNLSYHTHTPISWLCTLTENEILCLAGLSRLQYCILGKKVCAKKVNVHASRKTNNILNNIMKKCSISHSVLNYIIHYAIQRQFLKNQKDAARLYWDFWAQILEESNMLFSHFCVSLTVALVLAIVHAICRRAVGILIIQ